MLVAVGRVDIDGELRRHQKTTYPPKDSGITRYDFAHIARYALPLLNFNAWR